MIVTEKIKVSNPDVTIVKSQSSVQIVKSQSSVQIEIDSKGSKKYTVKVYDDDPEVAKEKAISISNDLDIEIKK